MQNKIKDKTKIACLALCERVCNPNLTYKKLNGFTPNQILSDQHLKIVWNHLTTANFCCVVVVHAPNWFRIPYVKILKLSNDKQRVWHGKMWRYSHLKMPNTIRVNTQQKLPDSKHCQNISQCFFPYATSPLSESYE